MYSYEKRKAAVELYLKYQSYSATITELGYPSRGMLRQWLNELNNNEDLHRTQSRKTKYNEEQKKKAVDYYIGHGRCISRTIRALGYPSRHYLEDWLTERVPDYNRTCRSGKVLVNLSENEKKQAVIELCAKEETAFAIATKYGVERTSLYNWKKDLLGDKEIEPMPKKKTKPEVTTLQEEVTQLYKQADELKRQVYQLQLEKDVLEKAAEIIKKDQGIIFQTLTNREKAIVIDTLRDKYKLAELLSVFHMAKSSYCYQINAMNAPDKYEAERKLIRQSFSDSNGTYGYRRIHLDIKATDKTLSEKVVRRLMKEEKFVVKSFKKKKYNSYMGEISPAVENKINRDFHSESPNEKWLTDITEFHIPAGKIYLSPLIDCFDGLPVTWTIGTRPDAELVNTMLDNATSIIKLDEKPIVHSDRGAHYRWPGWIERMEKAGLTRSMSKKGCSPDNSACEGFFGRLKNEMFYGRSWAGVTIDEFIEKLDRYIHWYAEKRRKLSLGGLSPIEYRKSLGLIAA
jgi:transposase InsO family protein/transposase-like protein